jgi:T1SS-143 domain-containing protein
VNVGADDPGVFSLSNLTGSLPTLFSKGQAVTYAVTDSGDADALLDTLTATAGGRTVFTLQVNPNGSWAFDLDDQLDHVDDDLNTENTALRTNLAGTASVASIDFSSIVQVTDYDGDTVAPLLAGDFAVTVEDDIPVINSISNIVGFNTGAPLTGVYDFKLGSDEPSNTAVDGVILQSVTGTTSGGRAIVASNPAPSVTWQSETDTSVVYAFSFDYFTSQAPSTLTNTATGTVTFNKLDGTYVFDLASPINGSTTFSTSDVAGLITYNTGGNNSPEITVKEYTADFVGVLYARTTDGGSGAGDDMNAGGDHTFTAGEVFNSVQDAYINVSTSTLGADSDTLQPEEVLNFDFFADNPVVPASPSGTQNNPVSTPGAAINTSTPRAYADTVNITLAQINISGQDDVAILLKLQKPGTNDTTTRLLLANSASDYVAVGANHVVTIGTDDYDFAGGYRIYGVQVLASTGNVTDGTNEAFELSDGPDAGTTQHDAVSLTAGGGTYADSSDNDVLKIVKIEVTVSLPSDADLQFAGTLIDADGDSAGNFNFGVHLEGDSNVLAGGAGSDYLNGTAAANTMSGGAGADFMAGGAGADEFQFASGASGITLATADTILDFATGVDKIATSKAAGNATIADGGALADFTAFVAAADAVLNGGAGVNDIYVAYNAAASGNAWAVVDENDSGAVDAGDTLIVLTGINTGGEIAAADFI